MVYREAEIEMIEEDLLQGHEAIAELNELRVSPAGKERKRDQAMFAEAKEAAVHNGFTLDDIMALTARLAQILAQEADYLEEMNISKIATLQDEKRKLIEALEMVKKEVARDRSIIEEMTEEEREDITQLVQVFHQILEENYRRLTVARAVNQKLVEAITDVVKETAQNDLYDQKGTPSKNAVDSMSVTLDQKA